MHRRRIWGPGQSAADFIGTAPGQNIERIFCSVFKQQCRTGVYELEEYGLPRMISRKIQNKGIINLEQEEKSVNEILGDFKEIGCERLAAALELSKFETYILTYFYQGITAMEK